MKLTDIQALLATDLEAVNQQIHGHLGSHVPLAEEIAEYIIDSGGKRIRPILVLLSSKAAGYTGKAHIELAAMIEMLHTATLLHDDVIDASEMRRNRKTANAVWGNQASVLVGDFLHARSFQMIASLNHPKITDILAAATSVIVEGELLQLNHCHDPSTNEETYLEIIQHKTGKLFEVSTHVGPILAECATQLCDAMADYGRHIGAAFQIIDDVLDYAGNDQETGKNIGDDLAEGKPTLPLIYVLNHGSTVQKKLIADALRQKTTPPIEDIQQALKETNAIEYVKKRAETFVMAAQKSLELIPASPYRDALHALADLAIKRKA